MIKSIVKIAFVFLSAIMLFACKSPTVATYYTYEVECLEGELDGSETVLVWGSGRNKTDAVEQAKKNAVKAILFDGVLKGNKACSSRPLLLEVNAQEKYAYYFNAFFKDGGDYKHYVSMEDTRRRSTVAQKSSTQDKRGMIVRVLRSELKDRLIRDEILKP